MATDGGGPLGMLEGSSRRFQEGSCPREASWWIHGAEFHMTSDTCVIRPTSHNPVRTRHMSGKQTANSTPAARCRPSFAGCVTPHDALSRLGLVPAQLCITRYPLPKSRMHSRQVKGKEFPFQATTRCAWLTKRGK